MRNDPNEVEGAPLRPNLRPFVLALVANLLLGGGLLGWPYLRGGWRADASAAAFARFSACLFEGEVAPTPGLTLPRGERARFATLALRADAGWPERCRAELAQVAQDEARFLFPSVKSAETEARARVRRLDRELTELARRRAAGSHVVPARPIELIGELQSALVEQTRAAGLAFDPVREAIVLGQVPALPTPSIVPLRVAAPGPWHLRIDEQVVVASAADEESVSYARVRVGGVDPRVARRPRIATLLETEPPWIVWATPSSQCADGCAQRAIGLAALLEDRQRLEPFAWLAAHPIAEVEDSIHVSGAVWVAAVGEPGTLEARRFALPTRPEGDVPYARPTFERTFETGPIERVHWIAGEPPALAWVGERAGIAHAEDGRTIELDAPRGTVRIASCGGWVALASEHGARVRRADGEGAHAPDVRIRPPDRDALRVTCDDAGLELWARRDGALVRARCGVHGCEPEVVVARGVDRFDVAHFRGAAWVAHASGREGAVLVTRLREGEPPVTFAPAACWTPASGLCGEPRLAADAHELVLAARQGSDLRVIVSGDGDAWRGLAGLEQP